MDFVSGLRCRECGRTYPAEALHVCDFCFGPLEVTYDYERVAATMTRERIASGPRSIWRYADLLPVSDASPVDLGAGFTPLVRADRLAAELGLGELWIKDDTANPDRLVQGPCGVGGTDQGPAAGVQDRRLRLHRESGQLGGGPRRPGGHGLGRPHPP